ncbi:LAETG motif-containing sortase-dependent surface protein [Streptomyces sp. NPDC048664]|uniref:LAETG motif-containing sortase-dependent surface protein n=1 Tax=Streptomyces sp. NPDC048664 TaxID=3154505 RepID=UPI003428B5AD
MSISSRTARTVRIVGAASAGAALALGVAGNALACDIRDFSAVASCDSNGKGVITVTDTDPTGQTATVSVYLESNGADAKQVGVQTVKGAKKGATVSFPEDWAPKAQYRIRVSVKGSKLDEDVKPNLVTPDKGCKAPESTPPASTSPKPSATPSSSDTPSATPSESDSTAPATTTQGNSPSPAAGTSNLAETGASSNTPMIAGIAGALVVIGGGAVYFGMRRRGASKNG